MIKCEGCIDIKRFHSGCIIWKRLKQAQKYTPEYPDCVCMDCIIKIVCNNPCEEVKDYSGKLMDYVLEHNLFSTDPLI